MKAREYNSPLIKELIDETTTEELNKIDKQMSKEQTAVEWFFKQLVTNRIIVVNGSTYWDKVKTKYEILLEQAKEIQKDQHIKTWEAGLMKVDFNEYYNETYGGNND